MKSSCIASCLDAQVPINISFRKIYSWPESDAEFLKLLSTTSNEKCSSSLCTAPRRPSCHEKYALRQRYLRSYNFSKEETVPQRAKKWFSKEEIVSQRKKKWHEMKQKIKVISNPKDKCAGGSFSFFQSAFKFLLSCIAKVDVNEF
ncbi:hypothetical protein IFM89_010942 [Coptis chinensis]|uniref:Uncharacterized protein n=1 Tax=Coptis chinensis TaxID=261450 RepID=A0A835IQ03_9MAGN|nr:hypothetical protein IFM89_010942 [Coptis chinensis]